MTPVIFALALSLAPASEADDAPEAQLDETELREHRARNRLSFASGGILTGWGVANIAIGVAGNLTSEGRVRYFHQGNWAWNTVNLALGISGLVGAARGRGRPVSALEGREQARKAQLAFAINAGLDVLYVSAGAAMWQLTLGDETPVGQRVGGYGEALVLQGAFLFAFDVAMLWAHELLLERAASRDRAFGNLRPSLRPYPGGGAELGLALRF